MSSIRESRYRFIVVARGSQSYGVRDRAEGRLVEDGLTRAEARYMVWKFNGGTGSVPRYLASVSQSFRDLTESYGVV